MEKIWKYYGTDWAGMILILISIYYLGKQKKRGFIFGMFGCTAWMAFAIMTESLANLLANFIYIILDGRGFLKWRRKQPASEP